MHTQVLPTVPLEKGSNSPCFLLIAVGAGIDNFNVTGSMATFFSVEEHLNASKPTLPLTLCSLCLTLGALVMLGGKLAHIMGQDMMFPSKSFHKRWCN